MSVKNGIILNGKTYRAVRTNNVLGTSPDPCMLCDPSVKRRCQHPYGYPDKQPCKMFNSGYMLAHFEKSKE